MQFQLVFADIRRALLRRFPYALFFRIVDDAVFVMVLPNIPPSAPRDSLVTELAKAQSGLERIEAQHIAAKARIAALRNEPATLDATPRPLASEPPSGLVPHTPADKVKLFRQLFRGRPDLYPTRFVSKKTGKPGYVPACSNKFVPGVCELPKVKSVTAPGRRSSP